MHLPTVESRVESLELRTSKNEASILQMGNTLATKQDIKREIEQAYRDIGKAFDDHAQGFVQEIHKHLEPIEKRLDRVEAIMATKEDLSSLEMRIRAEMATKEDLSQLRAEMAAMETRIYTTMDAQRESLLDGIRQLLQQGGGNITHE